MAHWRPMMWVRRLHLYLGLFLFPWACLYGATAFLFNHPSAFADATVHSFAAAELAGTEMEDAPSAEGLARQVFAALEKRKPEGAYWRLENAADAKWGREFAFATAKGEAGRPISLLFDLQHGGGTIRIGKPAAEKPVETKAPFAVGSAQSRRGGRGPGGGNPERPNRGGDRLELDRPYPERIKAAAVNLLAKRGISASEVTVTSVPPVQFTIDADGALWRASFDPLLGGVEGKPAESKTANELSWRGFLLRLHTAHGYPASTTPKWFWAAIVDAMAFVMVFWGVSGIMMWRQLKAERRTGWALLTASAAVATALAIGMHGALAG
ncbi:MAG TPA: hypothetical protein VNC50_12290 [Planctomycetia bacterium]|nr:hypothetical protein [Planctomycetia bacterium]